MKSETGREITRCGPLRGHPLLPGLLALTVLLLSVAISCSGESVVGGSDGQPGGGLDQGASDLPSPSDMTRAEDLHQVSDLTMVIDATVVADAAGDLGGEDADQERDMSPEMWPIWDCTCEDPLAVCYIRWCARPDLMCDPSAEPDPCPEGYGCSQRGYCTCHSEERNGCAPRCDSDADCGSRLVCNRFRGICEDPLPCRNDTECLEGMYCIKTESPYIGECGELGTLEVGQACSADRECSSGVCNANSADPDSPSTKRCRRACLRDSDCSVGEGCTPSGSNRAYCQERTEPCTNSCGADERCVVRGTGVSICEPTFCRWTQDCTEGDCIAYPGLYRRGTCSSGRTEKLCKRNEYRTHPDDPFCRQAPCNYKEDCAAPYTCEVPYQDFPVPGAACSRPVTLDCDQPQHTSDMGRSACPADMGL